MAVAEAGGGTGSARRRQAVGRWINVGGGGGALNRVRVWGEARGEREKLSEQLEEEAQGRRRSDHTNTSRIAR
jgi:hypothetical protein